MEYSKLAPAYKEEYIEKLFPLLRIPSVFEASDHFPYGKSIDEALHYMLSLGKEDGFLCSNIEGHAGHIEFGAGEEVIGLLGHLDVVPPGDGWSTEPFQPVIEGDCLYARGAQDDKGPVVAAYLAMKLLKDQGFVPKKRVRLILGTDEERDWKGIEHYFKKEEMPVFGFTPDAVFPVIHAEKGLIDSYINFDVPDVTSSNALLSFSSGERLNMVPDAAEARLKINDIEELFQAFLNLHQLKGNIQKQENTFLLTLYGKTAHGSKPENGVNAALHLLKFLKEIQLHPDHAEIVNHIIECLSDPAGSGLNCNFQDEVSGNLTCNMGIVDWKSGEKCRVGVNVRYPVTIDSELIVQSLKRFSKKAHGTMEIYDHLKALHIKKEHPHIQALLEIYNRHAEDTAIPHSIGGATYARALETGVAYGALFKDSPDTAHQANEHIQLKDMIKAIAIYAEAIQHLSR
ncbi:dipeptidase PepV [Halobacillus sp. Marseille-P3879]|uniref:dipeptidase PepV n=1 Tax=Halobacillus sp. Marseille-P3879 TaxID=2045014 RepID=UPI000C7AE38F|nr:dipeptidase PepV [Halobacillus sp. Marseille-P3879]